MGVLLHRWYIARQASGQQQQFSQDYFKGLNFVLNEQPDKAIEVFIKALEVDSETVELHLALGGLFRRKGQVDRATRIHQNLIARPNLTEQQRQQAIHELAQDYYKAGLLDRAENLFLELKDSPVYRMQCIEGLCSIYQQEKEWADAIDILRLHRHSERMEAAPRIAHFWCEIAQSQIDASEYSEAKKSLRSALSENKSCARAVLLKGDLYFKQAQYRKALQSWQGLAPASPALANLVVDKSIVCYRRLSDTSGLQQYLQQQASIPKEAEAFNTWRQAMIDCFGEAEAERKILNRVENEGLSNAVAAHLHEAAEQDRLPASNLKQLLKNILLRAKVSQIEYTCGGCGFDTKALHWHCPNCGSWDSFG
ncbi:MAG: lipopolysaccharide assembly protein LapB [Gammaproteobacteria bacterium]|nr:lipopolysaccharide assembly protein LapB [Gammaproteobacteria bacterium]